jgi:hypothetical protein
MFGLVDGYFQNRIARVMRNLCRRIAVVSICLPFFLKVVHITFFQFKLLNVLTNVRMQVACRHESFSSDNESEQIQFDTGRGRKA